MYTEVRRCLEELDVEGMQAIWPGLMTRKQTLISLHMARTRAKFLEASKRMYSHLWLLDHGYPSSFLQDEVKVVSTVGLSVNFTAKELKPAGKLIEKAMSEAVNDAYANGESDPKLVKALLTEAGNKERRKLFGNG